MVQPIQNGLGSPEKIAQILGADRLAIGVVGGFGASVPEPGVAHHNGMEMVRFGSFARCPAPTSKPPPTVWTSSGFTVKLFEDTDQMVWEKFIMNVAFSGTTCATGLTIGQVMANPSAWAVAEACAREAVAVAQAAGITARCRRPNRPRPIRSAARSRTRDPSMLLDFDLKRRGEVDAIVGQVAVQGEKYGLDTPVTRTIANLIRARESDYLRRPLADLHALDQVRGPRGRPH